MAIPLPFFAYKNKNKLQVLIKLERVKMNISKKTLTQAFNKFLGEAAKLPLPSNEVEFVNKYFRQFMEAITYTAEHFHLKGQKTMPFKIADLNGVEQKGKIIVQFSSQQLSKDFDTNNPNCGTSNVFFHISYQCPRKSVFNSYLGLEQHGKTHVNFVVTRANKGGMHYFANEKDAKELLKCIATAFFNDLKNARN